MLLAEGMRFLIGRRPLGCDSDAMRSGCLQMHAKAVLECRVPAEGRGRASSEQTHDSRNAVREEGMMH